MITVFARDIGNVYTDEDKDIADLVVVLAHSRLRFRCLTLCSEFVGVLRAWEAENFGNYKHDFAVGDWGDLRHVACIRPLARRVFGLG